MTKVEVELHDDVISVLHKLKNINDTGIELIVPEGAVLFDNILNLRLIQSWSDKNEKVINFQTDDVNGQNMLVSLEEGSPLEDSSEGIQAVDTSSMEKEISPQKMSMPKFKFSLPIVKLKKGKILFVLGFVLLFLGLLGFLGFKRLSKMPEAEIKIIVNSEPLTRSLEIKVKHDEQTNAETKLLKGTTYDASVDDELTMETTGEKIIGEKAEGVVTIFNKTDKEKEFDEGTTLIFEDDDDKEYEYVTKDDVTVPPREEQEPDPENPEELIYIKGTAEVDVEAAEIGKKYNLDDGEDLEVEDQKTSEFEAEVKEDIDGGKEEKISIVSQEDLDVIIQKLLENAEEKALRALGSAIPTGQKLVSGSEVSYVSKETFSHTLDEETEELTLGQTFVAKGLVYESLELDSLIETLVEEFVPENFVLSTKERSTSVEVLGNTETTVLSETEADLQVTIKTFVVPDISENTIKQELMGKGVGDAQKYLGSIRNVKTYEFNLSPRIPLLDFVPKDESRIIISLERE